MDTLVKYGTFGSGSLPRTWTGLLALLLFGFGARLTGQQAPCLNRTLAVTVTTQDYQPVRDLTAANFSATLGHDPVRIVSASLATGARIVIVIDSSGSMSSEGWKWMSGIAAAEGLYLSAPPDTALALMTFAGKVENRVDFSQGVNVVAGKLKQLEGKGWSKSPPGMGRTALTDAIVGALDLLGPRRLGDAIYLVSDGGENASKVKESRGAARLLSSGVRLFAFFPIAPSVPRPFVLEEFDVMRNVAHVAEDSGGDFVICMPGGLPGPPYDWPHDLPVFGTTRKALHAARAMDQMVTEFYRLELELPKEVDKPTKWRLEAAKLMAGKNVHLRVNYPHKLQPCQ